MAICTIDLRSATIEIQRDTGGELYSRGLAAVENKVLAIGGCTDDTEGRLFSSSSFDDLAINLLLVVLSRFPRRSEIGPFAAVQFAT